MSDYHHPLASSVDQIDQSVLTLHPVTLTRSHLTRLRTALESAFTLSDLRHLMRVGLEDNRSLVLDSVVPVENRTLSEICHGLVLWALHDKTVGLNGLLAAALNVNPTNPQLCELGVEFAGITFVVPACPYPGMKPFTPADSDRFYGRTAEIERVVDRMRRHPFLALIGPSGCGKSSLLHAGILPALMRSHHFTNKIWRVRCMRPGAAPYENLTALFDVPIGVQDDQPTLLPSLDTGVHHLLLIDQYEELYTVSQASQRKQFEHSLLQLLNMPDFYLLISARADFYGNLMTSALWEQIRNHRIEITPPYGNALREAVALPALDQGVQLTPQLVERLLADAGDEPGVLPFVQETLVMLWGHADEFIIGLDAYVNLVGDKSGRSGLQFALSEHADQVFSTVLDNDRDRILAKRLLLRLVQFGEGRLDTRRQQTIEELRKGTDETGSFNYVVSTLTANRLITLSDEARRADLSHEALIRGWPQIAEWIAQRRAAEQTRRRLEEKANDRQRLRQSGEAGGILDPIELAEAEAWVQSADAAELGISDELANLIVDSRKSIERTATHQRRRNQELVIITAAALVAMVVAILYFLSAQTESQKARTAEVAARASSVEADSQRATAVAERAIAEARQVEAEIAKQSAEQAARRAQSENLAAIAQLLMQRDRIFDDRSLILARDAVLTTWNSPEHLVTVNADAALRSAVDGAPSRVMVLPTTQQSQGPVYDVAFNPAGSIIATANNYNTVSLWNSETLELLSTFTASAGSVNSVAFSPDGILLATGDTKDDVRLWDTETGELLRTLSGHTNYVTSIAFSPDGRTLASSSYDGTVRLWDVGSGESRRTLTAHDNGVTSVAFSPDGHLLATGGGGDFAGDNSVRLWNVLTGAQLYELRGHRDSVNSIAFDPGGFMVASGSSDGTVRVWNVETGASLYALDGRGGKVYAVAFSPDGSMLAVGSEDSTVRLWNMWTRKPLRTLEGHDKDVTAVAFSPDGNTLVSGSYDEGVRLWDLRANRGVTILEGHSGGVNSIAFSPDGAYLTSGSGDGSAQIYDVLTGNLLLSRTKQSDDVTSVAFSSDGAFVASGGGDNTVRFWNAQTGMDIHQFEGHESRVTSIAFNSNSSLLASGSWDTTVRLWDVSTGDLQRILEGHRGWVRSVAFSHNDSMVASGSADKTVRIWDVQSGSLLFALIGHKDGVTSVAFSPDDTMLASGSTDNTVRIWDVRTGELLKELEGHSRGVAAVAFSPDGSTLASGSWDKTIRLWAAHTGEHLRTLEGHSDGVNSIAFSPDGSTIASGSIDNTVRLWPASIDLLLKMADRLVQRPTQVLTGTERRELGLDD